MLKREAQLHFATFVAAKQAVFGMKQLHIGAGNDATAASLFPQSRVTHMQHRHACLSSDVSNALWHEGNGVADW